MPKEIHQRIIGEIAKKILKPTGLIQRGNSRLWYADRGWHASIVEFQPRSGRRGTYLNLGVTWLWYPQDCWVFDIFYRAVDFLEFKDETSFRDGILSMSNKAITHCRDMQSALKTPLDAFEYLKDSEQTDWGNFNLGILAGITNQKEVARLLLEGTIIPDTQIAWQKKRNARAYALIDCLDNKNNFSQMIEEQIIEARALLNLPIIEGPQLS